MLFLEKYFVASKKNGRALKRSEYQYACYSVVDYLFLETETFLEMDIIHIMNVTAHNSRHELKISTVITLKIY